MEKSQIENITIENSEEPGSKYQNEKQFVLSDFDMEFLCSAKQYKKYIAKSKPLVMAEKEKDVEHFMQYKNRIGQLFQKMLGQYEDIAMSSSDLASLEIQDIFKTFVKKCIHHFEVADMQEKSLKYSNEKDDHFEEEDDESMFGNIDNNSSSFWGKKIKKSGYNTSSEYKTPTDLKDWFAPR
jgi:hypothetical protein